MEICENKQSGRHFVVVVYLRGDKMLLVNPKNEIKALERHLFEDPIEQDEMALLANGIITKAQVETYREYEESRTQNASENFKMMVEGMTTFERQLLLKYLEQRQQRRRQLLSDD